MLRKFKTLFILATFFFYAEEVIGQTSSYGELQAAYLFNFAKYIRWPEETPVFVIGVYGDPEIMVVLDNTLKGKKVGGKAIELKVIETIEEATKCNIVYVTGSGSKGINELVSMIGDKDILIVTEEDLIKKGASISFVVEDDRLRFKLKKSALTKSGLVASEGLLKLAIQL